MVASEEPTPKLRMGLKSARKLNIIWNHVWLFYNNNEFVENCKINRVDNHFVDRIGELFLSDATIERNSEM